MPNDKSVNKIARAAERKRLRNRSVKRSVKTYIAKAESSIKDKEESTYEKTTMAISRIDKAVNKRVIHRNKGARFKARLMKKLDAARRGYVDAVIRPSETRARLIAALEALGGKSETLPPKKHGNIPL